MSNQPPFDIRTLSDKEHEIYDRLCKGANPFMIYDINIIFNELVRLRLKVGTYDRGVT